jgi:hypothetical protein
VTGGRAAQERLGDEVRVDDVGVVLDPRLELLMNHVQPRHRLTPGAR